ncbi:MAG: nicotinate-nucleotide adenylyltransferase, partial [Cyanobium sp.]
MAAPPKAERIALFGTSADPPTTGHRALLVGLLQLYPKVVTWASDNPLKRHAAPLAARQALLEALVAAIGEPRLQVVQELSSPWAVETLEWARRLWPGCEPVFVVGSDLLPQMPRWLSAAQLLPGLHVAVAPRRGWPLATADLEQLERLGARVELLALEIPATASSAVRRRLAAGPDPELLPDELWPVL